jgi:hypothetical protein
MMLIFVRDFFRYLVARPRGVISLKAVAQEILNYAMTVFKLPKGICKVISSAIARFW